MRSQIEGSKAIARAVARCRPNVVPAYPITPQTHIVEAIGAMVKAGELTDCAFITVESEFAAMSAAIGACAVGARAYTATASQGLLYMAEALFNASGLGLPIVMTVANRAVGAPINIWNDQSDSMSMRDCGWIQLYAQDNQEAVSLHPIAFRLAEELSTPVMVCVDGFVLTHAVEAIDVPDADVVDGFLPPYVPRQQLDPADPVAIGAMVAADAFTEVRYLSDHALRMATTRFSELATAYWAMSGQRVHPVTVYGPGSAPTVVIVLGSLSGTIQDAVDGMPDVALVVLTMYRPFPTEAVREALTDVRRVVVLERAFSPGAADGPVTADVRSALAGMPVDIHCVVAGLGGRPVRSAAVLGLIERARTGALPKNSFLDLDADVVWHELGPLANGLRR